MLNVRSFQLSDYSPITQFMQEVLSDECYEETMEAFANQLSWDSELVMVAEMSGQVIGTIIGTIDHHRGYYYRVAVAEAKWNGEVDAALIRALKQRFDSRGVRTVVVPLDEHNETLLPLYRSLGYEDRHFEASMDRKLSICSC
ncbi:GNAT family N-acetyltransferase [Marinicrinis sediminis]|uniref:GNAT family N-acetyltransferase n=1 Tax=Marinicrinis sediminis TaxID=1652465 RepID=A0ABW5RFW1_9BACL